MVVFGEDPAKVGESLLRQLWKACSGSYGGEARSLAKVKRNFKYINNLKYTGYSEQILTSQRLKKLYGLGEAFNVSKRANGFSVQPRTCAKG